MTELEQVKKFIRDTKSKKSVNFAKDLQVFSTNDMMKFAKWKDEQRNVFDNLNKLSKLIYKANKEKGFWDKERNVGEQLMLVNTELSEAMQAHQKGVFATDENIKIAKSLIKYDENGNPIATDEFLKFFKENIKDCFEDENGDAVIRMFDNFGGRDIDIETHIILKLLYNSARPRLHGNKY